MGLPFYVGKDDNNSWHFQFTLTLIYDGILDVQCFTLHFMIHCSGPVVRRNVGGMCVVLQ